MLTNIIIATIM